jgi:hypothetical protein
MNKKRLISTLADGRLAITHLSQLVDQVGMDPDAITPEDEASYEAYVLEKTMFELSRPQLQNPTLTGEALEKWRYSVHFDDYTGSIPLTCRECTTDDLPSEQAVRGVKPTFRDAWEDTGALIQVNMPKARVIHMGRIRKLRDAELAKLDVPYMQALESGNPAEQQRIAAQKQTLRDIPQAFDLSGYGTPEELMAAWPAELLNE